jgi:hypothetical protein
MNIRPVAFVVVLLCGALLLACGGGSSTQDVTPSIGQILYVINNGIVTTYSIDPNSLAATMVEQPVSLIAAPASLLQFDPSPHDHFLYAVWADGQTLQHLSVFPTDASAVPQIVPIQVLNADSLSQFNMHPSGRFAYMLEVTDTNGAYQANIRLFRAHPPNGTLQEDPRTQGAYGPAPYFPAFIYGFSTDGKKLYDTSFTLTGSVYRERSINLTTGILGTDDQLIRVNNEEEVAIGPVIVLQYQSDTNTNQSFLDILPNAPNSRRVFIHCTAAMLSSCATANNVQLDKSGRYLFLTDPVTQAVHVAAVDLVGRKIRDTGGSIPMTSQTPGFAFNPNGTIVYALLAGDNSVHFYHFNRTTGSLTEGGTPLPLPFGAGICPAQRL